VGILRAMKVFNRHRWNWLWLPRQERVAG